MTLPLHRLLLLAVLVSACEHKPDNVFTGYAEADYVRPASPIGGTLARLYVGRGGRVDKDGALFVLEQDNERAERVAAAAKLQKAQATLADLEKGKRPEELAVSGAQLAQAQAALKLSQADLARESKLQSENFVSPARLDSLREAVQRDQAHVRELQSQLRVAHLGARQDELAAAREDVRAAQAQLDQADWKLAQKSIRAPLAAEVADVYYREGELVPAGAPVLSLLAPSYLRARFFVAEPELGRLRLGQEMLIQCDGCATQVRARLSFIANEAQYTAPLIYSEENRASQVFLIEATPYGEGANGLHPGQPLQLRFAPAR